KTLDQLPALADIRDVESLNAEFGFSDQGIQTEQLEAGNQDGGPGLTVVGGTDDIVQKGDTPADSEQSNEALAAATISDLANTAADMVADGVISDSDSDSSNTPSASADNSDVELVDDADSVVAGPDSRS
ncbi:MAG: hypothetical protein AAGF35_04935, partial [Pseudomonadota bacterium]